MMIPQGLCLKHRKVRRTAFGRRQSTILSSSIPKIITFEVAGTTEDQELSVYPTQLLPSKINPPHIPRKHGLRLVMSMTVYSLKVFGGPSCSKIHDPESWWCLFQKTELRVQFLWALLKAPGSLLAVQG